jgi:6,7-dimethyl-8-ribityllumazine synthase
MKINTKILEHYLAALLVAGVAIWQTGNHSLKKVAVAAAVAVLGPVVIGAYNHFKTVANTPVK